MDKRKEPDINIVIVGLDYNFVKEVSSLVAQQLDMYFLDSLGLLEFDFSPNTIDQVVQKMGMDYFDNAILGNVSYISTFKSTIIAVDSIVATRYSLLRKLDSRGLFVYLHQRDDVLQAEFTRSPLANETLNSLFHPNYVERKRRDDILQKFCEVIVDVSDYGTIKCAKEVIIKIKQFYGVD